LLRNSVKRWNNSKSKRICVTTTLKVHDKFGK
jgi:hypothetical protein